MAKKLELTKSEKKEIAAGRAEVLICANCGCFVYYGGMNLLSLAIQNTKPACSYECNKALGQVK